MQISSVRLRLFHVETPVIAFHLHVYKTVSWYRHTFQNKLKYISVIYSN